MPRSTIALLVLLVLSRGDDETTDFDMLIKSKAGQVKLMAAAAQTETALRHVDEIISLATRWKKKLTPKTNDAEPVDDKEHIAFAINTTKGGGAVWVALGRPRALRAVPRSW